MLQAEINAGNNSSVNVIAKTDKEADIVKRLEELNKWQQEQKKLLEVKQIMQRQMLGVEQQTVYQMLGLQSEMTAEEVQNAERAEELDGESTEESLETSQLDEEEEVYEEVQINVEPTSYRTLTSGYETEVCVEVPQMKQKKPFLRKGEGLKQRFKIDPNEFRLSNLPKYKYANAHPQLHLKTLNKSIKIKETKVKLNNIKSCSNSNKKILKTKPSLDAQEKRFQNVLITSKNNCSSTPDTKSFSTCVTKNNSDTGNLNSIRSNQIGDTQFSDEIKRQSSNTHMIAWSKILDPLEIEPLQVPRSGKQALPQTEESIFELLEQKANEGSFDMDSTCLKEFMTRRIKEKLNESSDTIPIHEQLKTKRLQPVVSNKRSRGSSSCSDDDVEEEKAEESIESDDTTHRTIETASTSCSRQTPQVRVRFSNSNETHEYDDDPESTLNNSSRLSGGNSLQEHPDDTSKNELFAQFKDALFNALQLKADKYLANDSTLTSASNTTLTAKESFSITNNDSIDFSTCKELQEGTETIKIRLAELEREIQVFKDNNIVLMKAKQEHELQKSLNAQEHLEAMESLKDEQIRMEIYLHDERVKLEDEKRQFEQNMKMKTQGLIAKERKECDRLKEQVGQLEMQLKAKEANHTAAQARLRTQIRNMEREQTKLYEQIENLTRENKRLESENLKISREQNNKILLEINRNIAKLAPKQIQHPSPSIPDEGPPTLGASRTISKCIVTAAGANKNVGKNQKSMSSKFSNVKPVTNEKSTMKECTKGESKAGNRLVVEENYKKQQQNVLNLEEDEDDVLREFQISPENNKTTIKAHANINNNDPHTTLGKSQEQGNIPPPSSPRESAGCSNNMKREIVNADGSKDIWYPNGNLKKISGDGMIIRMLYYNKDIKETNINEGTVKYYYAETNTWHTTYLDGLEILEFPNGQVEHRHKNGIVEVHYPNNSVKIIDPKDEHKQEEWRFPDGTHLLQMRNGDKILSLPNGQKEIHNKLHKRREYPDGTVKIVYPDGSTETRYSNGRIRLKDKEGKLVMDTDMTK